MVIKNLISALVICLSSLYLKPAMAFDLNNIEQYTSCYDYHDTLYVANGQWYVGEITGRGSPMKYTYGGTIGILGDGILQYKKQDGTWLNRIFVRKDLITSSGCKL